MDDIAFVAYTAGFFDADGSVGVYPNSNPTLKRGVQFFLRASISQKHWMPIILEWKAAWDGGCWQASSRDKSKKWWDWTVRSNDAAKFLADIYPYLRNKREQAKLAMEFQARARARVGQHRSRSEFDWQRMMSDLIKQLKQQPESGAPALLAEKHRLESAAGVQLTMW